MKEFLAKTVFSIDHGSLVITLSDLLLIILVVIITITACILTSKFIRKNKFLKRWEVSRQRLLFQIIRACLWIIALFVTLEIVGLDIKGFLNYEITGSGENGNFKLTPRSIFFAIAAIFVTRLILMGLERLFVSDSPFRTKNKGKSRSVFKFVSYLIWLMTFLLILNSTGLNLTILWGAGAALLVGVGFGLQEIIADLVSGLFLLFEGNLKEGDIVELTNGIVGKVENLGIRTSRVLTRDDYTMIIPNSQFIVKEVINWTHNEENTRFHIDVGVAYGSDTKLVERVLLECAEGQKDVSKEPVPFVRFNNFGESSLDFQLFFWSRSTFRIENTKSVLRFLIDEKFRQNKIQIPFPQHDVYIKKFEARSTMFEA